MLRREKEGAGVRLAGGIYNPSNTCYMNSCLQLLLRFIPLSNAVRSSASRSRFPCAFKKLFMHFRNTTNTMDCPREILKMFNPASDAVEYPGDPADFLTWIIGEIADNYGPGIGNLFACIPAPSANLHPEYLIIENVAKDSVLNAVNRLQLKPQMVILVINRADWINGEGVLNHTAIDIPEMIVTNPPNRQRMQLYGVMKHHGSYDDGHYSVYIRDQRGWLEINDELVVPRPVSLAKQIYTDGDFGCADGECITCVCYTRYLGVYSTLVETVRHELESPEKTAEECRRTIIGSIDTEKYPFVLKDPSLAPVNDGASRACPTRHVFPSTQRRVYLKIPDETLEEIRSASNSLSQSQDFLPRNPFATSVPDNYLEGSIMLKTSDRDVIEVDRYLLSVTCNRIGHELRNPGVYMLDVKASTETTWSFIRLLRTSETILDLRDMHIDDVEMTKLALNLGCTKLLEYCDPTIIENIEDVLAVEKIAKSRDRDNGERDGSSRPKRRHHGNLYTKDGNIFVRKVENVKSIYYACTWSRRGEARKRGVSGCKATIIFDKASGVYRYGCREHSQHDYSAKDIIEENKRDLTVRRLISDKIKTTSDDENITARKIGHSLLEQHCLKQTENDGDTSMFDGSHGIDKAIHKCQTKMDKMTGSLTASRFPKCFRNINGNAFLCLESITPPVVLFMLDENVRMQNTSRQMIIVPVVENRRIAEGFDHMYVALTISNVVTPCFWVLTKGSDAHIWGTVSATLNRKELMLGNITDIFVGYSDSYRHIATMFTNPDLRIHTLKVLFQQELKRITEKFQIKADDPALCELFNFQGSSQALYKITANLHKKAQYENLARNVNNLVSNRTSWISHDRIYKGPMNIIATWALKLHVDGSFQKLMELIQGQHISARFHFPLQSPVTDSVTENQGESAHELTE